ncbi:Bardet-Biedl syndrome 4 protein homolog [Lutzomyia longipalpis]|uniref:Bardet-Biedl syndrome 4 protein homolog n=1 Tax=Lutzomyia longipalpis TaxID=7200 RepID=UPI002483570E|nr:Bardet-Biedl syndrome 4 protein homolog [Lutzomyia longipalpis]
MNYYECNGIAPSTSTAANVIIRRETSYSDSNVNWLLYLMYARRDFSYCKLIIEEYLKKNYDTEYLYFVQGLIAREEDRMTDALKCFQNAIELNSKKSEYFKEVAKTLYKMGRLRQSLDVFLKAEALLERPDNELYFFIGDLLLKNVGQPKAGPKEAKEYILRGIQNGKHLESYKKLAEIYISEEDLPKAIEVLENSLQINPDDPNTLTQIGVLYLTIGSTQNAFTKLLDALNIDAKCSKALTALGAILQSKNDVDGALNKYKLLSNLDEEGSEIWSNVGLCFYKKQKLVAAIACLKKAVWISPLNFNALYNLGYVLLKAQQFASAFHVLATAVSIKNNHAECLMLLGACLRYLHDRQGAFVAFERSTMQPDALKNPLIYLNFAIFCHEEGKYQQSRIYLANVIRMSETVSIPTEYIEAAHTLTGLMPQPEKDDPPEESEANVAAAAVEALGSTEEVARVEIEPHEPQSGEEEGQITQEASNADGSDSIGQIGRQPQSPSEDDGDLV